MKLQYMIHVRRWIKLDKGMSVRVGGMIMPLDTGEKHKQNVDREPC